MLYLVMSLKSFSFYVVQVLLISCCLSQTVRSVGTPHFIWRRGKARTRWLPTEKFSFDPQNDDWPTYVERLGHYFVANKVTEEAQKHSILLTVCGTSTYKLLRSLVRPGTLDSTSYDDLVTRTTITRSLQPSYNASILIAVQDVKMRRSLVSWRLYGSSPYTVSTEIT